MSHEELLSVDAYYITVLDFNGNIIAIEKLDGNGVDINKIGFVF